MPESSEAVEHLQSTQNPDKLKERSAVGCDVLVVVQRIGVWQVAEPPRRMGSVTRIAEFREYDGLGQVASRAPGRASQVAEEKTEMITDLHVAPISLNYSTMPAVIINCEKGKWSFRFRFL